MNKINITKKYIIIGLIIVSLLIFIRIFAIYTKPESNAEITVETNIAVDSVTKDSVLVTVDSCKK